MELLHVHCSSVFGKSSVADATDKFSDFFARKWDFFTTCEAIIAWSAETKICRTWKWNLPIRYTISSVSRQLKMKRIVRFDWLPEQARWRYLSCWGLPAASRKKSMFIVHLINPLLTKLVRSRYMGYWPSVRSRWLDIGQVHFCFLFFACLWTETDLQRAKKRTWPISSHRDRTSLVNKGFTIFLYLHFFFLDTAGSPERARWSHLVRSRYWPRSFFASLWTSTSSRSINTQKRTWPISNHNIDHTLGQ